MCDEAGRCKEKSASNIMGLKKYTNLCLPLSLSVFLFLCFWFIDMGISHWRQGYVYIWGSNKFCFYHSFSLNDSQTRMRNLPTLTIRSGFRRFTSSRNSVCLQIFFAKLESKLKLGLCLVFGKKLLEARCRVCYWHSTRYRYDGLLPRMLVLWQ